MTPLRQRLIDDLCLRNYSPRTVDTYVGCLVRFSRHFGRSPDTLGAEEIRLYQLDLIRRGVSWSLYNQTACAMRFFYRTTLGRPELVEMIPFGKKPKTLPVVLGPEEVLRFLDAAPSGRDRLMLPAGEGLS